MSKHGAVIDRVSCPKCSQDGGDTTGDNLVVYESGYKKCFACDHFEYDSVDENFKPSKKELVPLIESLQYKDLKARKISEDTCRHFDYGHQEYFGSPCQVASYKDSKGTTVAQKIRFKDKKFIWTGDPTKAGFYGQHLYKGGQKLVVTEGEIDALSVSDVIGNNWPVVSVPGGAQSAAKVFKDQLEWLRGFEEIILFFDADDAGREAVDQISKLIPNKIKNANYPAGYKDANDLLVDGKRKEIKDAYWSASDAGDHDNIVDLSSLCYDEIMTQAAEGYPFPFRTLSDAIKGIRKRELTLVTAGSGIGKSTIVAEIAYHLATEHKLKIGNIFLEESVEKTAQRYIALDNNVPLGDLRADPTLVSKEDFEASQKKIFVDTGMLAMSHFGSMECDKLISKLEYLAVSQECDFIILDHISMVVSGLDSNDERKDIDKLMTALRSFIERTGVGVIAIVHLKRPSGQVSFNQGKEVSLSDLRGSAGLEQMTDTVIAAERNQQSEKDKHKINFRVLKCREFGDATGLQGYVTYSASTGRLVCPGIIY